MRRPQPYDDTAVSQLRLIAAEGKYHKACHASYVSKVKIKVRKNNSTLNDKQSPFDKAFDSLVNTTKPEIESGKAYDTNFLLNMFNEELEKLGNASDSYTKQKLKLRLVAFYKVHLVFRQPPEQSKPEIVYSSSISLIDVINGASHS